MIAIDGILDFFINTAQAQTAPAPGQTAGGFSLLIMMLIFLAFLYLTVWRPQNKRAKELRNMLDSLAIGDEVMTTGGIIGKITKITDSYTVVVVGNNVELTFQKSAISNVLPKGTLKSI